MEERQINGSNMLLFRGNGDQAGVSTVNVTAPGTGYTTVPAVSFTGGGGGTGAAAYAVLSGTTVDEVVVTNPGTGYTSAPSVVFTGGGGTGATATSVRGETFNLVACLRSNDISQTSTDLSTETKCGKLKLPGTQDASISFELIPILGAAATKVSLTTLQNDYKNKTESSWKIGPVAPVSGDPVFEFSAYLSEFNIKNPTNDFMSADGTLQVDENGVTLTELP